MNIVTRATTLFHDERAKDGASKVGNEGPVPLLKELALIGCVSWAMAGLWDDGGLCGDDSADVANGSGCGGVLMYEDVGAFVREECRRCEVVRLHLGPVPKRDKDGVDLA